jgi:Ulp1 family protease
MHWYLTVINARNIEIQVLDSLGTTFDRNDLTDSVSSHKLNNYYYYLSNLAQHLIPCFTKI